MGIIGYNTVGANTGTSTATRAYAWIDAYAGLNGTVPSIVWYGHRTSTTSFNLKAALYNGTVLVGQTNQITVDSQTPQWWTLTFSSPPTISAGNNYYIAFVANNTQMTFFYDPTGSGRRYSDIGSMTFPDPITWTTDGLARKFSIYANVDETTTPKTANPADNINKTGQG